MARLGRCCLIPGLLLSLALAGCGSNNNLDDLRHYIGQVKAWPKGKLEPLPTIRSNETFLYASANLRDPFTPSKAPAETKASESLIKPDLNRPKEALEGFPLDTLRMVGTLQRGEEKWSIIKAPDGAVYRVRPDNYMGQNYGRIVGVSDDSIQLVEIVPDGQGGWMERPAALALSEETAVKSKK